MKATASAQPRVTAWRAAVAESIGLLATLGLLLLIFGSLTRNFFSALNLGTIANQIPSAMLLATAMTLVLAVAEIDLSVGSVLGLSGAVMGVTMSHWHWPVGLAVLASLSTGVFCGAFNGLVSLRWKLPSFIVTLGMLEMARGGAHALTHSQTQYLGAAVEGIAGTAVAGLSLPFLMALLVVVLAQLTLSRTIFGRYVIAVGTNQEAVRLSGIQPGPIKLVVFMLAGALAALAAVIDTSRFQSANPNAGAGFELQAIAAAVIGGTSLMGGRASVFHTFLGVVIIAVLNSGLAAIGARDETKRLLTGLVIIAAVIVDYYRHRLVWRQSTEARR